MSSKCVGLGFAAYSIEKLVVQMKKKKSSFLGYLST
jgi:hypothetical protein